MPQRIGKKGRSIHNIELVLLKGEYKWQQEQK